jgi:hypothetical protein
MESYITVIVYYSLYHFFLREIRKTENFARPLSLIGQIAQEDDKINIQHGLIGIPVFAIFVYSLFIFNWTQVLIYTISIRVGIFFLLQLIKSIFPYIKMFLGIGQLIFKITSIGSFIYFLFDNVF